VSELPRSAHGAYPSAKARFVDAIASHHAHPSALEGSDVPEGCSGARPVDAEAARLLVAHNAKDGASA
jgi:hypothetical protein